MGCGTVPEVPVVFHPPLQLRLILCQSLSLSPLANHQLSRLLALTLPAGRWTSARHTQRTDGELRKGTVDRTLGKEGLASLFRPAKKQLIK